MEHAIKIAAAIVERLPKDTCSPETTEGKQGFLHPVGISGALEKATLDFIVRDFTDQGLKEKEALLEGIVKDVMKDFPRSTYRMEVKQQYRNMKQVIDRHPEIVDYAMEAIRRAGLQPVKTSIRGGTDGSRLSFMGLPCPNIFAGEHAFHSRLEWVSRAGHGKGGADHRASGDDLGRAGLSMDSKIENNPMQVERGSRRCRHDPDRRRSSTASPLANGASASRIELAAAARSSFGLAFQRAADRADLERALHRAVEAAADRGVEQAAGTAPSRSPVKPARSRMRWTRASEANANGPGSSGPCCGSFGTCL